MKVVIRVIEVEGNENNLFYGCGLPAVYTDKMKAWMGMLISSRVDFMIVDANQINECALHK